MIERKTDHQICVREMRPEDFAMIATLSAELGYPVSKIDIVDRFEAIGGSRDHRLTTAHAQGEAVGWCHAYCVRILESEGYAELGGLVVNESWRRQSVGRALVADAETWARSRGFTRLRAYSGAHREHAHEFYRSLGYDQRAPSMFQRNLLESEA